MAPPNRLSNNIGQSNSLTVTQPAGSDRVLVASCQYVADPALSISATYGGNSMTEITGSPAGPSSADDVVAHMFYLLEADLPSDGDHTLDFSGAPADAGFAFVFWGDAEQATPDDEVAVSDRNSNHEITYDVTTLVDDSVIYALVGASDQNSDITGHGDGQTEIGQSDFETGENPNAHTEEFLTTAGTDTQSHAGDAATANSSYAVCAVAIGPVGTGTTVSESLDDGADAQDVLNADVTIDEILDDLSECLETAEASLRAAEALQGSSQAATTLADRLSLSLALTDVAEASDLIDDIAIVPESVDGSATAQDTLADAVTLAITISDSGAATDTATIHVTISEVLDDSANSDDQVHESWQYGPKKVRIEFS